MKNQPGPEYQPKNNQFYQLFAPFRLCYLQKSILCMLGGPKIAPLRLMDLKTSGYGAKPLNLPSGRGISPKMELV